MIIFFGTDGRSEIIDAFASGGSVRVGLFYLNGEAIAALMFRGIRRALPVTSGYIDNNHMVYEEITLTGSILESLVANETGDRFELSSDGRRLALYVSSPGHPTGIADFVWENDSWVRRTV